MKFKELKDSDYSLVEIKQGHPHCKKHGAMNRLTSNGIYRCVSTYKVEEPVYDPKSKFIGNACKAGCQLNKEKR